MQYSMRPFLKPLAALIKRPVEFLPRSVMTAVGAHDAKDVRPGNVALLENIRFEPGESANNPRLAKRLASLADIWVMDAFANAHRAHASTAGVGKYVPGYAGLLMQSEVAHLTKLLRGVKRPYVAIFGGAKISTKLGLIRTYLKKADRVLLGGALANTILEAEGLHIGRSLNEPTMRSLAKGLTVSHAKLAIPVDVVTATSVGSRRRVVRPVGHIGKQERILDIGPDTIKLFAAVLRTAKTIVWNGPLGLYEVQPFDRGTKAIARLIARSRAYSVAGGGETLDAITSQRLGRQFSFLSTGGGAMLEFLEGKTLPGVRAVMKY